MYGNPHDILRLCIKQRKPKHAFVFVKQPTETAAEPVDGKSADEPVDGKSAEEYDDDAESDEEENAVCPGALFECQFCSLSSCSLKTERIQGLLAHRAKAQPQRLCRRARFRHQLMQHRHDR